MDLDSLSTHSSDLSFVSEFDGSIPGSPSSTATSADLLNLDDYTVGQAWGEWAQGVKSASHEVADNEGGAVAEEDDLTKEYLDLSFLESTATVATC